MKSIYEFLVWDNCHNNCKFCFQRSNPTILTLFERQRSLNKVIEFLDSDKYEKGSHILLVGGELFDTPSSIDILFECYQKLIKKMLSNDIDLLYINTNLIYTDRSILGSILCLLERNKLLERVRFTTSFDFEGRFKSEDDKDIMLRNLENIKSQFPDLPIVTNIILTDKACSQILENNFNPSEFMERYKCWINFIPYLIYNKELSASRSKIFKTLKYIDKQIPGYLSKYINNLDLPQDKLLYKYDRSIRDFKFDSCKNLSCGHSENFKLYSEKETCFICDLKRLFNGE